MIQWDDLSLPPINLWTVPKLIQQIDITDMTTPEIQKTLEERGKRYGSFASHATIAQNIKASYLMVPAYHLMAADQKQALDVIADKIARILNGDPNYVDNWHDIQGYAKLVEDRLLQQQSL